jgi:hypothetical protein
VAPRQAEKQAADAAGRVQDRVLNPDIFFSADQEQHNDFWLRARE